MDDGFAMATTAGVWLVARLATRLLPGSLYACAIAGNLQRLEAPNAAPV
jgi:hypothetical protein